MMACYLRRVEDRYCDDGVVESDTSYERSTWKLKYTHPVVYILQDVILIKVQRDILHHKPWLANRLWCNIFSVSVPNDVVYILHH